jgi:AP2-like factor, euAP2 lineage
MKLIPLTQGYFAQIDDEDFEKVIKYKWCAMIKKNAIYAGHNATLKIDGKFKTKWILLHRFIMTINKNEYIDHIDHDGLNCQKSNLRKCTLQENHYNQLKQKKNTSSKFKGVCFNKQRNKWQANIKNNNKKIHLGLYLTENEAALAYNNKAEEIFGKFCCLNVL